MNMLNVMIGATPGLSPVLVWGTALVWMAVAVVLAAVATAVAGQAPRVREPRARLSWTRGVALQGCTVCTR